MTGLIAVATKSGLGYQTKDYYEHLNPDRTLVVDISAHNGMEQNYHWYPDALVSVGFPRPDVIRNFLYGLRTVLTAETPYNYDLYAIAREMGVKTVCVVNYEFFDWFKYPDYPTPDVIVSPSSWHSSEIEEFCKSRGIKYYQIHHPVDRQRFPFRLRTTKKFLHIAGNPATFDRNGTWDAMNAIPDGNVVTQNEELARHLRMKYRHSSVWTKVEDPNFMYNLGDVLVFPRRYGGNCLPLNEALSSGMPVIMPDIEPNRILPEEWLVPAEVTGSFEPRTKIDLYSVDPEALREKVEWFKNCQIETESIKADEIAQTISWEALKPKWEAIL